jgi:hypothetical protein
MSRVGVRKERAISWQIRAHALRRPEIGRWWPFRLGALRDSFTVRKMAVARDFLQETDASP